MFINDYRDEKARLEEKKQMQLKMENYKLKLNNLENELKENENNKRNEVQLLNQKKQNLIEITNERRGYHNNLIKKQQQFDRFSESKNHLTVYSYETPRIIQDIESVYKQGHFEKMPLGPGPIGKFY